MPSSEFSAVIRTCTVCGTMLELRNTRDIERKKFCSASCRNVVGTRTRIDRLPEAVCVVCGVSFKMRSTTHKYCSTKCCESLQVTRSYQYLNGNMRAYTMHLLAKPDRRQLSIEYVLSILEKQHGKCALSGVDMTCIKSRDGIKIHTNLSVDRIDSSVGYIEGNIQLVCAIVNIMKSVLSNKELVQWCASIIETERKSHVSQL